MLEFTEIRLQEKGYSERYTPVEEETLEGLGDKLTAENAVKLIHEMRHDFSERNDHEMMPNLQTNLNQLVQFIELKCIQSV